MGLTSVWHWLILLAVVALIFGTGKIKTLGKDLGQAIRGFKDGMNDETQSKADSELALEKAGVKGTKQ
ncbi:MAG: Sec-independent protein translocase subunit TatA [Succinivibrio sp.]